MASYQLWKKSHYQNAALGNSIKYFVLQINFAFAVIK